MSETKTGRRPGEPASVLHVTPDWRCYEGGVYRCMVYLIPEADGRFSVVAASLPGVASQGDSEDEALANVREALAAALSVYRDEKAAIPWSPTPLEPEPGAKTRWVVVHA